MITVIIENELGWRQSNEVGVPTDVFPDPDDARYTCLRFIDPYGDATFNKLQMPFLISDLQLLKEQESDASVKELLNSVEVRAKQCENGIGLHLKFLGD